MTKKSLPHRQSGEDIYSLLGFPRPSKPILQKDERHREAEASPPALKAIETAYNGYRFRSRLEARWAVFFDHLGIKYEYEEEGFAIGRMRYLPDFWLPEQQCWFEVKGQEPTPEEEHKARLLSSLSPKRDDLDSPRERSVFIMVGSIVVPENDLLPPSAHEYQGEHIHCRNCYWSECPLCGKLDITRDGIVRCRCLDPFRDALDKAMLIAADGLQDDEDRLQQYWDWWGAKGRILLTARDTPRLIAAYTAARQARFEFGEHGR